MVFLRLISGSFAFNFPVSMATHPTCLRLLKQSKPNLGVFPSGPAISVKYTCIFSPDAAAELKTHFLTSVERLHLSQVGQKLTQHACLKTPELLHIKSHWYCGWDGKCSGICFYATLHQICQTFRYNFIAMVINQLQ